MDLMHDVWVHALAKIRMALDHPVALVSVTTSIIKDDEGQIKWSTVLTGVLTAGLIAGATSLFSIQQTVTELRTKYGNKEAIFDRLPAIEAKQNFVLEELSDLRAEKSAATSDRFRGADAKRLEEYLQRQIDVLNRRVEDLEKAKRR